MDNLFILSTETTVGELMDILGKIPSHYIMNFAGEDNPALLVNPENQLVSIDNYDYLTADKEE